MGICLLVALALTALATLGKSTLEWRRARRRRALEGTLREELTDRLDRGDTDHEPWVGNLSASGRDVLDDLVDRHVELVAGRERDALQGVAEALEVERRARSAIDSGSRYDRLRALRRLALLGRSLEADWLAPRLSGSRAERETAARVLAVESPSDRRAVVEYLLGDGPLSVFGLDALHDVTEPDPLPLLRWLADAETDDAALLAQALLVLDQVGPVVEDPPLSGVVDRLDHDDERVRAHACHVLSAYGWRDEVRSEVDVASLVADPSPRTRIAAYRMLDGWGDPTSRNRLNRAFREESDGRARLVLASALQRSPPGTIARFFADDPGVAEMTQWTAVEPALVRRSDPLV